MHDLKFGIFLPTGDFAAAKKAALRAESEGFYSVSINDHFFTPLGKPQTPQLESMTTLTAVAAVTERIRLAPSVVAASFRTPPMLAKITSTLDQVSQGRLTLGLGGGLEAGRVRGPRLPVSLQRRAPGPAGRDHTGAQGHVDPGRAHV